MKVEKEQRQFETDKEDITKEEIRKIMRKNAQEKGNLDGTDVELFTGERITVKTSYDSHKVVQNEARANSIGLASLHLHGAPQKKIQDGQLKNLLQVAYYLGVINGAKEVNYRLENFYDEEGFDKCLAQGEAQLIMDGAWKAMRENRIGKQTFLKVDLIDFVNGENLQKFIRVPKNVRL